MVNTKQQLLPMLYNVVKSSLPYLLSFLSVKMYYNRLSKQNEAKMKTFASKNYNFLRKWLSPGVELFAREEAQRLEQELLEVIMTSEWKLEEDITEEFFANVVRFCVLKGFNWFKTVKEHIFYRA